MADIYMDVDIALAEVPVNILPLIDDTDFKTREVAITYDQAGMDLVWNFVTTAGAMSQTAVTPTTAGVYDWAHQGDGIYSIEIPASGGVSINNDTEGYGWFTGYCTGVLPWRGPVIGFRAVALNDALIDGGDNLDVNTVQWLGTACATPTVAGVPEVDVTHMEGGTQTVTDLKDFADAGYDPATNKVQGVVLVDTTTTNTDMRGTNSAALASALTTAQNDIDVLKDTLIIREKAINDASPTATVFDTTLVETTNNYWNNGAIIFTSGVNEGIIRSIKDYDGTAKEITLNSALPLTPANGDTFKVIMARAFKLAGLEAQEIRDSMKLTPSAGAPGAGSIDLHMDDIETDTAEIGTAGAGLTNINLPNQTMDIVGNITGNLSGSVGSVTGHTPQTADHTANIAAILTDTGTTLETHLTDIKGTGFVKDTDSLPQCLTATGFSTHDAAAVKTAMEAAGSDLDYLIKALVNKIVITEASGNTEMFNDASVTLGSVIAAFTSDGTYTTRKRMVI